MALPGLFSPLCQSESSARLRAAHAAVTSPRAKLRGEDSLPQLRRARAAMRSRPHCAGKDSDRLSSAHVLCGCGIARHSYCRAFGSGRPGAAPLLSPHRHDFPAQSCPSFHPASAGGFDAGICLLHSRCICGRRAEAPCRDCPSVRGLRKSPGTWLPGQSSFPPKEIALHYPTESPTKSRRGFSYGAKI